jgi:hypothetical protein
VRAKGLGLATVALEFGGEGREDDHLLGEQVDEHGHEEALALDALGLALAENFFEENALVGNVLIDDPEAFVVGSEDEGFAELTQGFEGGEGMEGRRWISAFWPVFVEWLLAAGVAVVGGSGSEGKAGPSLRPRRAAPLGMSLRMATPAKGRRTSSGRDSGGARLEGVA